MTLEKKRIYIVAKTYPIISKEYSELVCTAGVLEDGSRIRLYPVPQSRPQPIHRNWCFLPADGVAISADKPIRYIKNISMRKAPYVNLSLDAAGHHVIACRLHTSQLKRSAISTRPHAYKSCPPKGRECLP